MAVQLQIYVPDPAGILSQFNRIKIYRSATEDGAFVEVSAAGTRPVLTASKTLYIYVDADGTSDSWYKTSYFNALTSDETDQSAAQQIAERPAAPTIEPAPGPFDVISPKELRELYLFGVDLTDDAGNTMPDTLMAHYVRAAVARVEAELDLVLTPQTVEGERHDFIPQNYYAAWNSINLNKKPVRSVTSMQLILPPETLVTTYDSTWLKLNSLKGNVRLSPGSGQLIIVGTNMFSTYMTMAAGLVPHLFSFDYEAGYGGTGPAEFRTVPADIKHLVGMLASFGPLNIAGDLVFGAGLAGEKVMLDGLMTEIKTTQSSTNAGYGARLLMYRREITDMLPVLRAKYKGVLTTAI